MGSIIPYFYYDVLARVIPGAFTLATLLVYKDNDYVKWVLTILGFVHPGTSTTSPSIDVPQVMVTLVLGGLCYLIGVVYEAIDYCGKYRHWVMKLDRKDFDRAVKRFTKDEANTRYCSLWESEQQESGEASVGGQRKISNHNIQRSVNFRTELWDEIVFKGSKDKDLAQVFAHCHRFQAEYKMFLHLVWPSLLFAALSAGVSHYGRVIAGIAFVFIAYFLACRRNERRWWQALSFGKRLNILQELLNKVPAKTSLASQAAP